MDSSLQEGLPESPSIQNNDARDQGVDSNPQLPTNAPSKSEARRIREPPPQHSKSAALSNIPPSAAMPLSRASTLSWQQRPSSQGSTTGVRSRPISLVATQNSAATSPRASPDPTPTGGAVASKAQITQSLAFKDPSWFRQTEDRGLESAGYRRNQEEDMSDTASATRSVRLPGMSRETSLEPEKELSPPPESVRSISTSREGSIKGISRGSHRYSNSAVSSASRVRSPLPILSSQRFEPPSPEIKSSRDGDVLSAGRTLAMSPSQGRISPERFDRPSSPTKGLGGFVQSAMLKRSDSVNKRWSAQPGAGLSRGNSIASNRSGYDGSRPTAENMAPYRERKAGDISMDNSPTSKSRPGSSHSNTSAPQKQTEGESSGNSIPSTSIKHEIPSNNGFIKPALPPQRSVTPATEAGKIHQDTALSEKSPPVSPSKRWSPTKASWLENAINKPDSPRTKAPPPQQPSWMAEINRAKQQRGSVDLGKGETHKEVTTGGLIRSPPLGGPSKPSSIGGLPLGFSAGVAKKPIADGSKVQALNVLTAEDLKSNKEPYGLAASLRSSKTPQLVEDPPSGRRSTSETKNSAESSSSNMTEIAISTRKGTPSPPKAKPETPPKKDFKSNLKVRQVSAGKEANDDAEFKNVFGKLKRTQTQNYVAPDELKDNILRGKAGLATTGGPKKTERKDEFKESLLKRKEAMKAGAPSSVSRKISGTSATKEDPPTPEAVAKKKGLTRNESVLSNGSAETDKTSNKPEALAKLERLRDKPKPLPPGAQPSAPADLQKDAIAKPMVGSNFNDSLANLISRGPSPLAGGSKPNQVMNPSVLIDSGLSPNNNNANRSGGGSQLTHMTKARARGPKRRLPTAVAGDAATEPPTSATGPDFNTNRSTSPSLDSRPIATPLSSSVMIEKSDPRPLASISNNGNRKASQPSTPRKPSTSITPLEKIKAISPSSPKEFSQANPKDPPVIKQKPAAALNEDQIRRPSNPTTPALPKPANASEDHEIQEYPSRSRLALEDHRTDPGKDETLPPSVRNAAAIWERSPASGSPRNTRTKSPIKLPTRKDEETALKEAGLAREAASTPVGLGIQTSRKEPEATTPSTGTLTSPIPRSPRSPPLPAKKLDSIANKVISTPASKAKPDRLNSPAPQSSEVARLFVEYFTEIPSSSGRVNMDTQSVLASKSSGTGSHKIKTLRKQIWEVTGDGKSVAVPSHQEHILFEESMYLCTHVFGSATGTRTTEVYLWCGDGVPTSAAEDAQLFARKVAKDNNGRLLILQQGKEPANFFEALGGIVITRRGSSGQADTPSSAGATYMLCGRRHVGQIAFDEVDFHPRSLCPGFPYIVSARFGKLYLWKGSGSSVDELGCARLIGMDLGLTGEIEEIDEGKEPDSFWEAFPSGKPKDLTTSANAETRNWHLKPSCEKYTTRLFSVDLEAPRPKFSSGFSSWTRRGSAPPSEEAAVPTAVIREITPFTYADLVDEGVFVLDTFFEIFVYVPPAIPPISFSVYSPCRPFHAIQSR